MTEPKRRSPLVDAMRYAQVGTMLVAPIVVLGGLGYVLDRKFGSKPWLLLLGMMLGMAAGFMNFFRLVLQPPENGRGSRR